MLAARIAQRFDRSDMRACRRQARKPGAAGEIVAARQHRRCRRHQPRPQTHPHPLAEALRLLDRNVDPHQHGLWAIGQMGRKSDPHSPLGSLGLGHRDLAHQRPDPRPRDRRCSHQYRLGPDRSHTQRDRQGHSPDSTPQVRQRGVGRNERKRQQARAAAPEKHRHPLAPARQGEPRRDARGQADRQPRRAFERRLFEERFGLSSRAGQVDLLAPKPMLHCSARRRIDAPRTVSNGFARHGVRQQ